MDFFFWIYFSLNIFFLSNCFSRKKIFFLKMFFSVEIIFFSWNFIFSIKKFFIFCNFFYRRFFWKKCFYQEIFSLKYFLIKKFFYQKNLLKKNFYWKKNYPEKKNYMENKNLCQIFSSWRKNYLFIISLLIFRFITLYLQTLYKALVIFHSSHVLPYCDIPWSW